MAKPLATCPMCGRTLYGGAFLRPPHASHGLCRKHGSVPIRWLGMGSATGARQMWAAGT